MARCILALLALCVACVKASYTAEARASHSLPPSRKAGYGALFVAHHENTDMNTHFLKLAVTSAKTYRVRKKLPFLLAPPSNSRQHPRTCG